MDATKRDGQVPPARYCCVASCQKLAQSLDLVAGMRRRQSDAKSRGSRRHRRWTNALNKHALFVQASAVLHDAAVIADHDRNDCRVDETRGPRNELANPPRVRRQDLTSLVAFSA